MAMAVGGVCNTYICTALTEPLRRDEAASRVGLPARSATASVDEADTLAQAQAAQASSLSYAQRVSRLESAQSGQAAETQTSLAQKQAELPYSARQAVTRYEQTREQGKRDQLSSLFGVDIEV